MTLRYLTPLALVLATPAGLATKCRSNATATARPASIWASPAKCCPMAAMAALSRNCSGIVADMDDTARLQLDHALARTHTVPAYIGGLSGMAELV